VSRARGGARVAAILSRDHGMDGGRRNHGTPPSQPACGGRAISSGIDRDRTRARDAEEFSRAESGVRTIVALMLAGGVSSTAAGVLQECLNKVADPGRPRTSLVKPT